MRGTGTGRDGEAGGFRIEIADGEARILLERPSRRNAISEHDLVQLRQAVKGFGSDDEVRVIVLRSAVPGVFSAGADIGTLSDTDPDEMQRQFRILVDCCDEFRSVPKPIVGVVEGYCLGAGCALVAAADLVIAGEQARFGLPEVALDLAPVLAFTALFPVVAFRQLVYWASTGRPISAAEACAAGLVTLVKPQAAIGTEVASLVSDLKRPSAFTLAQLKRAYGTLAYRLSDAMRNELYALMLGSATHPATQAAVSDFLQRRRHG
jgi:enoyl-CoA hydratase